MGNGCNSRILICCKQKDNIIQGDSDISKIITENSYIKCMDIKKVNSIENKTDQNMTKSKSRNSSKRQSLKKQKNEDNDKYPQVSAFNNNETILRDSLLNNEQYPQNSYIASNSNSNLNHLDKNNNNEKYEKTKIILLGKLFSNKVIEIDQNGMKNSLKENSNEIVIFGIKKEKDKSDKALYDCNLSFNNNDEHKEKGKVFKIYFDNKKKNYILYFIHNSLILYYKINDCIYFDIDKDYYLILGDIFLNIYIKKLNTKEKQIIIQVEIENEKIKKYIFNQNEMPIKIGRINCNINIERNSISKLHSFINYSNGIFSYKDNKSTNGSSLLIREDDYIKIKGEMNFKLENIPFKIKEIPNIDES